MQNSFTEIERKFLIDSFPTNLPLKRQHQVYQAYLSLDPEVRIRRNVKDGQDTAHFLTIKSGHGLIREEVELDISKAHFYALAKMIGHPFVSKDFRVYQLPDGLELECSLVDQGMDSEFMYAEIEFPNVDAAKSFTGLPIFKREVTEDPAYRMKNYWQKTRR
ncbi:MAG: hypothetical protein K2M15_04230 [Oscillospiraceae bacterium]|nr:hypothetical protein [Oscillospiraceae bacterium]